MNLVQVAIPRPLDQLFTYAVPDALISEIRRGAWVRVPFGRTTTHGYLLNGLMTAEGVSDSSRTLDASKLKTILNVGSADLDIPEDVLKLCEWAHRYYSCPIGEVLGAAVPAAALGLRNKKSARETDLEGKVFSVRSFELNSEQKQAVETLSGTPGVSLLEGVTGSGKTEVYLTLARAELAKGRGVILLVPEISLTPQLHERLQGALGETVVLWHSAMADGKRRDAWAALRQGKARVVVGARSAVFAPVQNLGLIVVDEEHDASYKQEDRFRYHARDMAIVRGQHTGASVILGSATPSLETLERVRQGKFGHARLTARFHGGALPKVQIVDLAHSPIEETTRGVWAEETLTAMRATVQAGHQVLVFLNRRGFANFILCEACGHVPRCAECSVSLTVHKREQSLRCHHCGHAERVPTRCGKCSGGPLKPVGSGTESLEDDLAKLISGAKILRLDRDQITSHQRLEKVLNDFRSGEGNILLGTQMVVKGHDFPSVALVVVVLADALFQWPDFRAGERAHQTLVQVSGRAGRGSIPGRVLIQTYDPSHPVIQVAAGLKTREHYLEEEREVRKALGYPPFGRLVRVRVEGKTSRIADESANRLAATLNPPPPGLTVLGPAEAALEQLRGVYRRDLLLKAERVETLSSVIPKIQSFAEAEKISLLVDVDPAS